jgi:hypothetical protein
VDVAAGRGQAGIGAVLCSVPLLQPATSGHSLNDPATPNGAYELAKRLECACLLALSVGARSRPGALGLEQHHPRMVSKSTTAHRARRNACKIRKGAILRVCPTSWAPVKGWW